MTKTELPEVLIYRKKKYIIPFALLIFLGILLLSVGIMLGIVVYVGEDLTEVLQDMFQMQSLVYLLPGLAVVMLPTLLLYAVVSIGERRFLRIYREMPQEVRWELYQKKVQDQHPGGLLIYEAEGYILFSDRCFFGTPQIVKLGDIVWGYIGHSDFQYTDTDKNFISPSLRFFSLYFHTKDGRRHRVYVHVSYQEAVQWFIKRCPRAILGYGKEQKRQAEEVFRREAEQKAFLTGEDKDSYLRRKKGMLILTAGGCLAAVLFLTAGVFIRQYSGSDTYEYRKNMKKAEKYFEAGEWSRAYQAYYAARDYAVDEEEALKGMLLSQLGMAKNDGYLDSIIRDYENLFFHQELFTDEMDISGWYFECVEYYLRYDDPMGAVDLLERGIETFSNEETVVETGNVSGEDGGKGLSILGENKEEASNEKESEVQEIRNDILRRMQKKKEDILSRCQIESVTEYIYGDKRQYIQYDETGQEILNVRYLGGKSRWEYKSYDKEGHLILVEVWEKEDGEEEKRKTAEETLEYDTEGHLYYDMWYDTDQGVITYEAYAGYDEEGNQTYYQVCRDGEIFLERECRSMTDSMQIDREYNADYPPGEDPEYYIAQRWDENGNLLETAYYTLYYSVEEIAAGEADAWVRYCYTYDERGNCTSMYNLYGQDEEPGPCYEREYDDRDHLVKETYYYGEIEDSCVETTVWEYNGDDLLVKKERHTRDADHIWLDYSESYRYDEAGRLIRTDYSSGSGTEFSVIKEYDLLGNQVREYRIEDMGENLPEDAKPEKEWEYQYHYNVSTFK